jgi:hypothetical protein
MEEGAMAKELLPDALWARTRAAALAGAAEAQGRTAAHGLSAIY